MKLKNVRRLRLRPVLLTAAATAALLATVPPAQADPTPDQGIVEFVYAQPGLSDEGDRVTWEWTVENPGNRAIGDVRLTHAITPELTIVSISKPCTVTGQGAADCAYGSLQPGAKVTGTVVAEVPADTTGSLKINGRITWKPDN
jgi:hypothetical protein